MGTNRMNGQFNIGHEQICTFSDINKAVISGEKGLVKHLNDAARKDNFGILGRFCHTFPYQTCIAAIALSESHIMAYHLPSGRLHYELSSCRRENDGKEALKHITQVLGVKDFDLKETKIPLTEEELAKYTSFRSYDSELDSVGGQVSAVLFGVPEKITGDNIMIDTSFKDALKRPIITASQHAFDPKGFTGLYLNHGLFGAVHTYPENNAVYARFVDLFAQGTKFNLDDFIRTMQPQKVVLLEAKTPEPVLSR